MSHNKSFLRAPHSSEANSRSFKTHVEKLDEAAARGGEEGEEEGGEESGGHRVSVLVTTWNLGGKPCPGTQFFFFGDKPCPGTQVFFFVATCNLGGKPCPGAQFTCFTSTKVQLLTYMSRALLSQDTDLAAWSSS